MEAQITRVPKVGCRVREQVTLHLHPKVCSTVEGSARD